MFEEYLNHLRVELTFLLRDEYIARLFIGERFTIRSVGCHSVEGVSNTYHTCESRNLLGKKSVWVAATIQFGEDVWIDVGVRFKGNSIIEDLFDSGALDLNEISRRVHRGDFPKEDYVQLTQLIGYTVGGWGELSTSPPEMVAAADKEAEALVAALEAAP